MGLRRLVRSSVEHIQDRSNLMVVRRSRWVPYRDAWDRPDLHVAMTPEVERLSSLFHGQMGVVGFSARVVYIAIPKSANSYMRRWINSVEAREWMGLEVDIDPQRTYEPDATFCHTVAQLPGGSRLQLSKPSFRYLTVVRHPFDRALSAYLDKSRGSVDSPINSKLSRQAWRSFPSFVEQLGKHDHVYRDGHWAPQAWLLKPVMGDLDRILQAEDLDRSLVELQMDWNLPPVKVRRDTPSHRTNAAQRQTEYFNEEVIQTLSELYAADLKLLGYESFWPAAPESDSG